MSFRRPKFRIRRSSLAVNGAQAATASSSHSRTSQFHPEQVLVSTRTLSHRRPEQGSKDLYLPGPENLVCIPGNTFTHPPRNDSRRTTSKSTGRTCTRRKTANFDNGSLIAQERQTPLFDEIGMDASGSHDFWESAEQRPSPSHGKKHRQWETWSKKIIPSLIRPYMKILNATQSLRLKLEPPSAGRACVCGQPRRPLLVTCIYFEFLELIEIRPCNCYSAALQLLERGLFPCAPCAPSLAVSLDMLEFVRNLFLRMPPNTTAWCESLEAFLRSRGYKLTTVDTLRRRFSKAMQWYSELVNATTEHVKNHIYPNNVVPQDKLSSHNPPHPSSPPGEGNPGRYETQSIQDGRLSQPSRYLRERCPLCFGGSHPHVDSILPNVLVCVDACFTHKRRKTSNDQNDEPQQYAQSMFLSVDDVQSMERLVDSRRSGSTHQTAPRPEQDDGYEGSMKVPVSVLNDCSSSFLAADDRRRKASTSFFSDTGLMALLCRHDCVLWTANMTSAGEKQHYVLALLHRLFEHLPPSTTVGVLYDIGCQLHRSCVKWDFLADYLGRLTFAISVFHAYGHQWPCQLIYHPRKCVGFGLTDGEGCERLWSALKKLIPHLRVSGHFKRLFTLETQIRHINEGILWTMGDWLSRKWYQCQTRKQQASEKLQELGIEEEVLRACWAEQVQEQTKPLPRQSNNKVKQAVDAIIAMQQSLEAYKKRAAQLDSSLLAGCQEIEYTELQEIHSKCEKLALAIKRRQQALGVDHRTKLTRLIDDEYAKVRMNALTIKKRIRDRLRQRKFELERLERSYRQTVNSQKLHSHMESSIVRREPGIQKMVATYNKLCIQLKVLSGQGQGRRFTVLPRPIQSTGLFKLDVDDEIWQDVGLEDDSETPTPQWLSNDDVRQGIVLMLEVDRCLEEEQRLRQERCNLQEWTLEEWRDIQKARQVAGDNIDMVYQLNIRQQNLCRLCLTWQAKVRIIPCEWPMVSSWGPSEDDLRRAAVNQVTGRCDFDSVGDKQVSETDSEDESYGISDGSMEDNADAELLDAIEDISLVTAYQWDSVEGSDLTVFMHSASSPE